MTNYPTEEEIRALNAEFLQIKKYRERIIFYDQHFGLINYRFPEFNRELDMLFKQDEINVLSELFEKERRNAFLPERKFCYGDETFVFNIVPLNSYPEVLNDYIISGFTGRDKAFQKAIGDLKAMAQADPFAITKYKIDANEKILLIADKLASKTENSLRKQFMNVFYHGYLDYFHNSYKKFTKRKKIIELYLYSQGILYRKYIDALSQYSFSNADQPGHAIAAAPVLDWMGRIMLFKELGILDLLLKKYSKSEKSNPENKVGKILCLILGENPQMSDKIIQYINHDSFRK